MIGRHTQIFTRSLFNRIALFELLIENAHHRIVDAGAERGIVGRKRLGNVRPLRMMEVGRGQNIRRHKLHAVFDLFDSNRFDAAGSEVESKQVRQPALVGSRFLGAFGKGVFRK